MGWKNWPYWFRGTFVGIIITLFLIGLCFVVWNIYGSSSGLNSGDINEAASDWAGLIGVIIGIPLIIISSIMGAIVGSYKTKNLKNENSKPTEHKLSYPIKGFLISMIIPAIMILGSRGPELEIVADFGIAIMWTIPIGIIGYFLGWMFEKYKNK